MNLLNITFARFFILAFVVSFSVRAESFKVLTLNAWQFPTQTPPWYPHLKPVTQDGILSKYNIPRQRLIVDKISQSGADVVTFQEIWGKENIETFSTLMNQNGYSYCTEHQKMDQMIYTYPALALLGAGGFLTYKLTCAQLLSRRGFLISGGIAASLGGALTLKTADYIHQNNGNGLLICSKYPIQGKAKVVHYDWRHWTNPEELIAAKGSLYVVLQTPMGPLSVATTHMDSRKYSEKLGTYIPQHTQVVESQINALDNWIQQIHDFNNPLILTGDFNLNYRVIKDGAWTRMYTRGYEQITGNGAQQMGLTDAFLQTEGEQPHNRGFTVNRTNKYDANKKRGKSNPPEVIDYIFYHRGKRQSSLQAKSSQVMFENTVTSEDRKKYANSPSPKSQPLEVSDHFGVMTQFQWGN